MLFHFLETINNCVKLSSILKYCNAKRTQNIYLPHSSTFLFYLLIYDLLD